MFIGHYAVAFAAKRAAPATSLATLIAAVQFPDLLWPLFLLAGLEQVRIDPGNTPFTPLDFVSYPWTHSMLMVMVWAVAFAFVYHFGSGYRPGTIAVALGVVSHWVLDAASHRPDLPLYPWGGVRVGLGLWNHPAATIVIEGAMFAVALAIYARATRATGRTGTVALVFFVALALVSYAANILAPPPPSERALALGALAVWITVPLAAWVDRHRDVRRAVSGTFGRARP